jgi:hypothetical protein
VEHFWNTEPVGDFETVLPPVLQSRLGREQQAWTRSHAASEPSGEHEQCEDRDLLEERASADITRALYAKLFDRAKHEQRARDALEADFGSMLAKSPGTVMRGHHARAR